MTLEAAAPISFLGPMSLKIPWAPLKLLPHVGGKVHGLVPGTGLTFALAGAGSCRSWLFALCD